MLRVDNLHFSYAPGAPVLRGVDLTLRDGEVGVLLGQNGSGKTTLFNCILGALRPQAGRISLDGEDLRRMPPRVRAGKIAYVPQDVRFGALSVFLASPAGCQITGVIIVHDGGLICLG